MEPGGCVGTRRPNRAWDKAGCDPSREERGRARPYRGWYKAASFQGSVRKIRRGCRWEVLDWHEVAKKKSRREGKRGDYRLYFLNPAARTSTARRGRG